MLFQIVGYLIMYLIMTFIFVQPVLYAIKTSDGRMERFFESFKYTSQLRQRLFGKKALLKQSMLYGILLTLLIFILSFIGNSNRLITVVIGGAMIYFFTKWVTKKSIQLYENQM